MRVPSSTRAMSSMPVTTSWSTPTITSPGTSLPAAAGAARLHLDDAHARILRQAGRDLEPLRQPHLIAGNAEPGAAHAAVLQDLRQHVLGGVGGDREADALRAHDDRGVDADHLAARVDERPAGIAGIEGRIGLDDVADQAAVLRAQRAADRADDAGRYRRTRSRTGCRWRRPPGRA